MIAGGPSREETRELQRERATESMDEERSNAVIWDIEGVKPGERSFTVLRPVPEPSLCNVKADVGADHLKGGFTALEIRSSEGTYSVIFMGLDGGRRANASVSKVGRRWSSRAWRMLPSMS